MSESENEAETKKMSDVGELNQILDLFDAVERKTSARGVNTAKPLPHLGRIRTHAHVACGASRTPSPVTQIDRSVTWASHPTGAGIKNLKLAVLGEFLSVGRQ